MSEKIEKLIDYCRNTKMTYSYKPVLIMALIEHGGVVSIREAANYFVRYYGSRLSMGLVAERQNSIYSNLNCTLEQVIANIKANPLNALLNSEFFVYDKQHEILSLIPDFRAELKPVDVSKIIQACLNRLDDYYIQIKHLVEQDLVCFHEPEKENGYLSNRYQSAFSFCGIDFTSVEQYMMYRKAVMFEDFYLRNHVLSTSDVAEIKEMGRIVKNYNDKIWRSQRQIIACRGLLAKFSQNDELRTRLLNTGSAVLAECAVSDKIWGIGLSMDDDCRFVIEEWQGENLLGFSLMQVRNMLQDTRNLRIS